MRLVAHRRAPDLCRDRVLVDDVGAAFDQQAEHAERLGRQLGGRAAVEELGAARVEEKAAELNGRSASGDYYIAMELLDGRAVSTYLRERSAPSVPETNSSSGQPPSSWKSVDSRSLG